MAVSYSDHGITPMAVLKKACELHQVPDNEENYWLDVKEIMIPIGRYVTEKMELFAIENDFKITSLKNGKNLYEPIYTINRGYDHRGSKRLFEAFGIKADKAGDIKNKINLIDIVHIIRRGNM